MVNLLIPEPLGMPLVRKMEPGLWEVRIHLDKPDSTYIVHCTKWINGASAWIH